MNIALILCRKTIRGLVLRLFSRSMNPNVEIIKNLSYNDYEN